MPLARLQGQGRVALHPLSPQVNKHMHIYAGWIAYVAGVVQCYRGLELVSGAEELLFSAAEIDFAVRAPGRGGRDDLGASATLVLFPPSELTSPDSGHTRVPSPPVATNMFRFPAVVLRRRAP